MKSNIQQPDKFVNIFSSLWWCVASLTTIGAGDISPITIQGHILSVIVAFLWILLIAIPTGIISSGFYELIQDNKTNETIQNIDKIIQDDLKNVRTHELKQINEKLDEIKKHLNINQNKIFYEDLSENN